MYFLCKTAFHYLRFFVACNLLNCALEELCTWRNNNRLTPHCGKCEVILLTEYTRSWNTFVFEHDKKTCFRKRVRIRKADTWQICCYRPQKSRENKGGREGVNARWFLVKMQLLITRGTYKTRNVYRKADNTFVDYVERTMKNLLYYTRGKSITWNMAIKDVTGPKSVMKKKGGSNWPHPRKKIRH